FVVGTVARLDPVKDLGTLIEAASEVSAVAPIVILVVGDGPERARLESLAATRGLASRVRFLGHRDDARRCLAACDAYVNCSVSEGVSLTILEAMAASLPIVATAVGGTPEVIDASCGLLVQSRDRRALASAMIELAQRPNLRTKLGAAARQRVE